MMKHQYLTLIGLAALSACATSSQNAPQIKSPTVQNDKLPAAARTLDMFRAGNEQCYDRDVMDETFVVDAHNHFRPFGGAAKSMTVINQYQTQREIECRACTYQNRYD